jgi:anti-sigma B factor antagonist
MADVLQSSSERPMVIELAGDIDIANADNVGESLCRAVDLADSGLVVDMTAVSLIDSSGMAMMVRVQHAASRQNCTVSWRAIQPFPAKALANTGLDQLLDLED